MDDAGELFATLQFGAAHAVTVPLVGWEFREDFGILEVEEGATTTPVHSGVVSAVLRLELGPYHPAMVFLLLALRGEDTGEPRRQEGVPTTITVLAGGQPLLVFPVAATGFAHDVTPESIVLSFRRA